MTDMKTRIERARRRSRAAAQINDAAFVDASELIQAVAKAAVENAMLASAQASTSDEALLACGCMRTAMRIADDVERMADKAAADKALAELMQRAEKTHA